MNLRVSRATVGRILLALSLATLIALFTGAVGMYFNDFLKTLSFWPAVLIIVATLLILVGVAIAFLVVMSNSAEPVASFNPSVLQSKKVVILPLSDIFGSDEENEKLLTVLENAGWDSATMTKTEAETAPEDLQGALMHRWVMNLCALRPHLRDLEVICLIASRRSGPMAARLVGLLQALGRPTGAPAWKVFFLGENGQWCPVACEDDRPQLEDACARVPWLDFDDYQSVLGAFRRAVQLVIAEGYEHADICIDITSGTKPVSVAGAAVALNSAAILSYVTNDREVRHHTTHIDPGLLAAEIR